MGLFYLQIRILSGISKFSGGYRKNSNDARSIGHDWSNFIHFDSIYLLLKVYFLHISQGGVFFFQEKIMAYTLNLKKVFFFRLSKKLWKIFEEILTNQEISAVEFR